MEQGTRGTVRAAARLTAFSALGVGAGLPRRRRRRRGARYREVQGGFGPGERQEPLSRRIDGGPGGGARPAARAAALGRVRPRPVVFATGGRRSSYGRNRRDP